MVKKKTDETEAVETEVIEETAAKAKSGDAKPKMAAAETTEEKPKKAPAKKAKSETGEKAPAKKAAKKKTAAKSDDQTDAPVPKGNRAEKIGVVASDKMTRTVVVRVDRLVKHPVYRKYVRKRKKFMAHDELGSKIGDKVRIVETRPLSARKRWRVVEIIQKAEL